MSDAEDIRRRYEGALQAFVEKVERDPYVLAAILFGSLSYDEVWEKSDIDVMLVGRDEKNAEKSFCLVENGINIHAFITPRGKFRRMMEGALQSSFVHSSFFKSRLLFTRDETLRELYEKKDHLGTKDQEVQLLRAGTGVLPFLMKAEKWFYVKRDLNYSFLWMMKLVDGLAQVEAFLHGEIAGREVVQQALRLNPPFFNAIYTDLINEKKTVRGVQAALNLINRYLDDRLDALFGPILAFLSEADGVRSATEVEDHFKTHMNIEGVTTACEWLADKGVIRKVSSPLRLTEKGRVAFEEAAFYYQKGTP
jgi:hypothetical protein